MHNKVENTTTSLTTIKLPNSAWINFDIAVESASPPCHRYFPPPASPSTYKQLLWWDKAGSELHCVKLVSHLSSLVADWEWRTADGILKFTSRFPPTRLQMRWSAVQCNTQRRVFSFSVSLFIWQQEGEKGRRGFQNTLEFIEDHEAHYSENPERPFTMHTSNASHMQIVGNVICFKRVNSVRHKHFSTVFLFIYRLSLF